MSRNRALLVAGVGILLATALMLLTRLREGTGSPVAGTELDSAPSRVVAESTPPVPTVLPEIVVESRRDVVPTGATSPATLPTAAASEPTVPEFSIDLHGRFVLLDSDGRELPPQDGGFELTVWRGAYGRSLEVEVLAGRWRATIDDARTANALSVGELEFGELRPTPIEPDDHVPIPESHELEIRAQLPRGVHLRVLDAASGADLSAIDLVSAREFPMEDALHPGAEFQTRTLGRGLQSPIPLDPLREAISRHQQRQTSSVLVGAPGYAWTLGMLDFRRGGEFVLTLERGGDLDLSIRGVDARAKAHLRLRSEANASPYCEEPLRQDGTLSFLGLAAGQYIVRAEIGDWFHDPVLLGETKIIVNTGERTRAELVLSSAPQLERADVGGVVYIASEWKAASPLLVMEQLGTPLDGSDRHATLRGGAIESTREGFDAFRWQRRRAEIGKYEFGTHEPAFSVVIDVPPGGRTDFELLVPPPLELSVFVVEDATGAEAAIDRVLWNPRRPEGVTGGGLDNALRDAPNHRFVVRAPAGEIDLQVHSWDYLPYSGVVDLSKGVREHTIRLQRSCGVNLKMKDGDTLVAFPLGWHGQLETVSGTGKASMFQPGEFEQKRMVTEPGTYSIKIPKLASYREVPMQTIEVFTGKFTEHVVQLEREHP